MTKRDIKQRRKLLTDDGMKAIIETVRQVHGKVISPRTVLFYLRAEKTPTGQVPHDKYGILPLFATITDAEKAKRDKDAKELSKQLMS